MKWNAFEQVSPCIDDMKKMLFPFSFKEWCKLGFVTMMAGNGRGGGGGNMGRGLNINLPSDWGGSSAGGEAGNSITGGAVTAAKEKVGGLVYLIAPLIIVFFAIMLIMQYISAVMQFVFLESLVDKHCRIKKQWRHNKSLGMSFFLFRLVLGILVLVFLALIAAPVIVLMIQHGVSGFVDNWNWAWLAWMIPLFLVFILVIIVLSVFVMLVFDFALPHMYFHRLPTMASIRATFKKMRKQKLEVFVFFLSRIVIGLVLGIAAGLLFIVLLIPFVLIGILPGIGLYFGGVALGWSVPYIALLVLLGFAWLMALIYVFSVCYLPMSVFSKYFSIRNYKILMKN